MRLVDVRTLKLVEFPDEHSVPYVILSHRWENEEVSYHDMVFHPRVETMAGYDKIRQCCSLAKHNSITYVWVDTCCIDKSSSAELQEAINSMYRWYANAVSCYIYLSDATVRNNDWLHSQWFTRGWTLQELIAPRYAEIFDRRWQRIGSRKDLAKHLSSVTRVPRTLLEGKDNQTSRYSIAERMSWAKGRKTTRIEDRAYSLLGLFNVSMPMLYGEGEKAFVRLQEEILRKSIDQSTLAWTGVKQESCDILARSPDNFPQQSAERAWNQPLIYQRRGSHTMTNEGLEIELELTPWRPNVYLAILNYGFKDRSKDAQDIVAEGIFIRRVGSSTKRYFARVIDEDLGDVYRGPLRIRHRLGRIDWRNSDRPFRVTRVTIVQALIGRDELSRSPFTGFSIQQEKKWSPVHQISGPNDSKSSLVDLKAGEYGKVVRIDNPVSTVRTVMLGFDFDYRVVVALEIGRNAGDQIAETSHWLSCMEKGCSLWQKFLYREMLDDRENLWIFKFSDKMPEIGTYNCTVNLKAHGEDAMRSVIKMTLQRREESLPWSFEISESTKAQSDDSGKSSTYSCTSRLDGEAAAKD